MTNFCINCNKITEHNQDDLCKICFNHNKRIVIEHTEITEAQKTQLEKDFITLSFKTDHKSDAPRFIYYYGTKRSFKKWVKNIFKKLN